MLQAEEDFDDGRRENVQGRFRTARRSRVMHDVTRQRPAVTFIRGPRRTRSGYRPPCSVPSLPLYARRRLAHTNRTPWATAGKMAYS